MVTWFNIRYPGLTENSMGSTEHYMHVGFNALNSLFTPSVHAFDQWSEDKHAKGTQFRGQRTPTLPDTQTSITAPGKKGC